MAISSGSVEEFRFPISFPFGSFSDEELAFPISVFIELSLVGASIFPPSDSVVAFQAKVSRFQRVRAAKPLRAKLESLDLRSCSYTAILVEIDWRSGERKAQYSMRWKSRSARVDRPSSRSRILGTYGFEAIQFCYDVDMNTLSSVIKSDGVLEKMGAWAFGAVATLKRGLS